MGSCTRRHFLLSICLLQMIAIVERQVFDFIGYMWAPILMNFFHMLFIIFGFYGAYHFRIKYIISYFIWNLLWIGWNAFLICFYLNVGGLDRDSDLLNLGTGSVSWFEVNGYGCQPTYPINITTDDPFRPIRPERVDGCLVDYHIVEVAHCGVQGMLALFGLLGALMISYIFLDEDDRLKHINKQSKHRQSLYSIEFSPSINTLRSRTDTILGYDGSGASGGGADHYNEHDGAELSPKPMTPRRVKRRSVMARGTNSRQSSSSRRSHHSSTGTASRSKSNHSAGGVAGGDSSSSTYARSSTRGSRRKHHHQNPVTKLLDQQQQHQQQLQHSQQPKQQLGSFHHKKSSTLTATNLQTFEANIACSTNDIAAGGSLTKTNNQRYSTFHKNIPPDPIYYNTHGQSEQYQRAWDAHSHSHSHAQHALSDEPGSPVVKFAPNLVGHYNPTYQHSTTTLHDAGEHADEVYNNRPPSVRSSYSNFHGTRPLSTAAYAQNPLTENLFAGLASQHAPPATPPLYQQHPAQQQPSQQPQQQHPLPYTLSQPPQHYPLPPPSPNFPLPPPPPNFPTTPPQNIPLQRRTASRESIRSMAFLSNGPPAYNLNYHTPPDSETTM